MSSQVLASDRLAPTCVVPPSQVTNLPGVLRNILGPDTAIALGTTHPPVITPETPTFTLSAANSSTLLTSSWTWVIPNATSGTYTITVNGQTTSAINWNDSNATIKSKVESLAGVGTGGVLSVNTTAQTGSGPTGSHYLVFADTLVTPSLTFSAQSVSLNNSGITNFGPSVVQILPVVATTSAAAANTTNYLYTDGNPEQADYGFPNDGLVTSRHRTSANYSGDIAAECIVTETQFELLVKGQGGSIRSTIDGNPCFFSGPAQHNGTAQAGTSTSITLASSASASSGTYSLFDIAITSGTGAGQQKTCIGYNGTTKLARIFGTWTTAPDATSVYEVRYPSAPFSLPAATGSFYRLLVDFAGVRASRHVRVECGSCLFGGFFVGQTGGVRRAPDTRHVRIISIGDSVEEGTGALSIFDCRAYHRARLLRAEMVNCGSGGTGYVDPGAIGSGRLSIPDRVAPPINSWWYRLGAALSGGTFTITVNGQTTAPIAYNASSSTYTVTLGGPSAGTYTLSATTAAGVQTATINFNDAAATIQTKLTALSNVGSGGASVTGSTGGPYTINFLDTTTILTGSGSGLTGGSFSVSVPVVAAVAALANVGPGNVTVTFGTLSVVQVLFRNSLASLSWTFTVDGSLLTGLVVKVTTGQYMGDLVSNLKYDSNGKLMRTIALFNAGVNDTSYSAAVVSAAAAKSWAAAQAADPSILVVILGVFFPRGGSSIDVNAVSLDAALLAKAQAMCTAGTLNTINGRVPYVQILPATTTNLLRTGSGNIGNPLGDGNADYLTCNDTTHATPIGHKADGIWDAAQIMELFR